MTLLHELITLPLGSAFQRFDAGLLADNVTSLAHDGLRLPTAQRSTQPRRLNSRRKQCRGAQFPNLALDEVLQARYCLLLLRQGVHKLRSQFAYSAS